MISNAKTNYSSGRTLPRLFPGFLCFLILVTLPQLTEAQAVVFGSGLQRQAGWVTWSKGLSQPTNVKKLYIHDKAPVNYEALKTFRNLEALIIIDSPLKDLEFLKDFPGLRTLELKGNGLRTLRGIENLKKLEDLNINHNFVSDLSPLDSIPGIKFLQLYGNEIKDIGPLSHFTDLKILDLAKNKITTLEPIAECRDLVFFSVYKCYELKNVEAVRNFTQAKHLNLSFLEIPGLSLEMLSGHVLLENLRIQGVVHNNKELGYLKRLTKIVQLTMGQNDNVTNIDSLRYLINLEYLDIHSNNVTHIDVVQYFPSLVKIVMYKNKVSDLSPLLDHKDLRSLFCFDNPVEDWTILYQMAHLQHLQVGKDDFRSDRGQGLKEALPETRITFF